MVPGAARVCQQHPVARRLFKADHARCRSVGRDRFRVGEYKWRERILPALAAFAEQHGHCDVSRSFVVPSDPAWPRKVWELKLGFCVSNTRSHDHFCDQTERDAARLEAIDFVGGVREYQWARRILPSFEIFHRLEGHANVPRGFVVPSESPWPEQAWGLKLGQTMYHMQRKAASAEFVDRDAMRLMELGFDAQPKQHESTSRCSREDV